MTLEAILPALAEYLGKKLVDRVLTLPLSKPGRLAASERIQRALVDHLRRVANWCAHDRVLRMSAPTDVEMNTVPLQFSTSLRKYRSRDNAGNLLVESELLSSYGHFLILGPPGAGKTTTLKRLARSVLTTSPVGKFDTFQLPVVIRLREHYFDPADYHPLLVLLASELGLEVVRDDLPERLKLGNSQTSPDASRKSRTPGAILCEGDPIASSLPKILNELQPVIFIDGLDEVSVSIRPEIEKDIEALLESCERYKVLVTCRSGDYGRSIGYINAVEVCSLQDCDIRELAEAWLGNASEDFMRRIHNPSLAELSQRPLFLTQLLAIFQEEGELPGQPFEVYEQVVMLMLREWDRERGLTRKSSYADFGYKKKLRFLAALAFQLMYEARIKVFSGRDLVKIYNQIHTSFGLPADEAELVSAELESHTGIIAESGAGKYEFTHLTIQEYLCAQHLVTSPFPQSSIPAFLSHYPAPLAIATALSADPAGWLAGILLHETFRDWVGALAGVEVFLGRLESENPAFANQEALGVCILCLGFKAAAASATDGRGRILAYIQTLTHGSLGKHALLKAVKKHYQLSIQGWVTKEIVAKRIHEPRHIGSLMGAYADLEAMLPEVGKLPMEWLRSPFGSDLSIQGAESIRDR